MFPQLKFQELLAYDGTKCFNSQINSFSLFFRSFISLTIGTFIIFCALGNNFCLAWNGDEGRFTGKSNSSTLFAFYIYGSKIFFCGECQTKSTDCYSSVKILRNDFKHSISKSIILLMVWNLSFLLFRILCFYNRLAKMRVKMFNNII